MRALPDRVCAGGIWFSVKQVPAAEMRRGAEAADCVGCCDQVAATILILSGMPLASQWRVLFHEVLHALNGELEEVAVDWQSGAWFAWAQQSGLLDGQGGLT